MDLILELPPSDGYKAILVVVNRFNKYSYLIPCNIHVTVVSTVQLFIDNFFTSHGLQHGINRDRGLEFTSQFYERVLNNLGIRLCCSTAFHSQYEGQTKMANQTLKA